MCYAKPAPRCSPHATKALVKAIAAYNADNSEKNYELLVAAQNDFNLTPKGIREIREKGNSLINEKKFEKGAAAYNKAQLLQDERERLIAYVGGEETDEPAGLEETLTDDERKALAADPSITLDVQEELSNDISLWVRQCLANNPSITPAIQEDLLVGSSRVHEGLASNPSITPAVQEQLLESNAHGVYEVLANNPSITPAIQEQLLGDSHSTRKALAANPSITPDVQEKLSEFKNNYTNEVLAANPSITPNIQEALLNGNIRFSSVPSILAANPSVTEEMKKKIEVATDPDAQYQAYMKAKGLN